MDAFINLIKYNPTSQYIGANAIMKYISSFATQIHTLHIRQPDISSSPIPAPLTFFGFFLCAMLPFHTTRVPAKENWERLTTPNYHNFFFFIESLFLKMNVHVCTSMYHVLYGTIIDWNVKYIVRLFFSHYTNILI